MQVSHLSRTKSPDPLLQTSVDDSIKDVGYANVFKTVCVSAAYYNFPAIKYLEGLAAQAPPDFQFNFNVTDSITIKMEAEK
jgi:uncharacterized protein YecE (DUF72 family)